MAFGGRCFVVHADVIANIFSCRSTLGQVGSRGCHGRYARLDFRGALGPPKWIKITGVLVVSMLGIFIFRNLGEFRIQFEESRNRSAS